MHARESRLTIDFQRTNFPHDGIFGALLLVLTGAVQLDCYTGEAYRAESDDNMTRTLTVSANRGSIWILPAFRWPMTRPVTTSILPRPLRTGEKWRAIYTISSYRPSKWKAKRGDRHLLHPADENGAYYLLGRHYQRIGDCQPGKAVAQQYEHR
ncbi:MAG: hypothetical protein ACLVJ6_17765 [Merdibacter sp.]